MLVGEFPMTAQELTCLGYYVVRPFEPPAALSKGLLPETIISLSPCLAELFPDTWALDWVKCGDEARAASAARFGVSASQLPALSKRVGELFNDGVFAWPNVWKRPDVARAVTRELLPDAPELLLIGVGVRHDFIDALSTELAPGSREGAPGVYLAALAGEPLVTGGSLLGWEVLGFEKGGCHSWFCNGLHVDAATRTPHRPGAFGLLEYEAAAVDVLRMMAEDPDEAEPATWVPAAVFQYRL